MANRCYTPQIGNGNAGFLFGVSAGEQSILNSTVFNQPGSGNFRMAAETTISGVHGAPESWSAVIFAAVPEASTWMMMLLGFVGLRFAFRQSQRKVRSADREERSLGGRGLYRARYYASASLGHD
jgi:hypothetical protein